jgi:hypothetical protein
MELSMLPALHLVDAWQQSGGLAHIIASVVARIRSRV